MYSSGERKSSDNTGMEMLGGLERARMNSSPNDLDLYKTKELIEKALSIGPPLAKLFQGITEFFSPDDRLARHKLLAQINLQLGQLMQHNGGPEQVLELLKIHNGAGQTFGHFVAAQDAVEIAAQDPVSVDYFTRHIKHAQAAQQHIALLKQLAKHAPEQVLAFLMIQDESGRTFGHAVALYRMATSTQQYIELLEQLAEHNAEQVLELLKTQDNEGRALGRFVEGYHHVETIQCYMNLLEKLLTLGEDPSAIQTELTVISVDRIQGMRATQEAINSRIEELKGQAEMIIIKNINLFDAIAEDNVADVIGVFEWFGLPNPNPSNEDGVDALTLCDQSQGTNRHLIKAIINLYDQALVRSALTTIAEHSNEIDEEIEAAVMAQYDPIEELADDSGALEEKSCEKITEQERTSKARIKHFGTPAIVADLLDEMTLEVEQKIKKEQIEYRIEYTKVDEPFPEEIIGSVNKMIKLFDELSDCVPIDNSMEETKESDPIDIDRPGSVVMVQRHVRRVGLLILDKLIQVSLKYNPEFVPDDLIKGLVACLPCIPEVNKIDEFEHNKLVESIFFNLNLLYFPREGSEAKVFQNIMRELLINDKVPMTNLVVDTDWAILASSTLKPGDDSKLTTEAFKQRLVSEIKEEAATLIQSFWRTHSAEKQDGQTLSPLHGLNP